MAEAELKRRPRAGGMQLYGHSHGQFTIRDVGGFFK